MNDRDRSAPQARPWWLGLVVLAIGLFWLYGATLLPQTATYAKVGPGLFVSAVGLGLVLLGLVLLVQIAHGERFEAQEAEDAAGDRPADWAAFGWAVAGAAVPLYTMPRFGFVLSAAAMFALVARAFGSPRIVLDLGIGLALAALAWWSFSALGVDLGDAWIVPRPLDLLPRLSLS